MIIGNGEIPRQKMEEEIYTLSEQALSPLHLDGKRILVIIPDTTRHAELPVFFRTLGRILGPKVKALDYLIATGTHHPLEMDTILRHVGITRRRTSVQVRKNKIFQSFTQRLCPAQDNRSNFGI